MNTVCKECGKNDPKFVCSRCKSVRYCSMYGLVIIDYSFIVIAKKRIGRNIKLSAFLRINEIHPTINITMITEIYQFIYISI